MIKCIEKKTGYDIIFIWKKQQEIGQACYHFVEEDVQKVFKDARLFLEE